MSEHRLDTLSLVAGLVFLMLGVVGLLQGAGWIDNAGLWAGVAVVTVLGATGLALSLRGLTRSSGTIQQ